jgi:hypothetical protein
MRRERLWLAVFLVAAGIGGAWVATDIPDPVQTVRIEARAAQPAVGAPVQATEPSEHASSIDEVMR